MDEGALTVGERFDRMDSALMRIENKLDAKLDVAALEPVLQRVTLLESGETPLARAMITQFTQLQQQVADVTLHGSQHAQQAISRIAALEGSVEGLHGHRSALNARELQRDEIRARAFRLWTLVFTAITTLALVISVTAAIVVATSG